jgi:hypothetical protein
MTDKDVAALTPEEKEEVCDRVQQENRGLCRPRSDHVEDNAGRRRMSKLRVNALWGKYVQSDTCCHRMYLNSLQEYLQTIQSPRIKRDSLVFRQIYGDVFERRYEYLEEEWGRAHNVNP